MLHVAEERILPRKIDAMTVRLGIAMLAMGCVVAVFERPRGSWPFVHADEISPPVVPTNSLAFQLRNLGRTPTDEELQIISTALALMQRYEVRTDSPLRSVRHDGKANEWRLAFDNGDPNGTFTISLKNKDSEGFYLQPLMIASRGFRYPQQAQKMAAQRREAARSIVWKDTREFKWRVRSFKIKPEEASRIALSGREDSNPLISAAPSFILGRWYCFGEKTKLGPPLTGYYVNGDSGELQYRESKQTVKVGTKRAPKDPWTKITPLEVRKPAQ